MSNCERGSNGRCVRCNAPIRTANTLRNCTKPARLGCGSLLKKYLAYIGVFPGNCSCDQRAAEMNRNGVKWCRDNIDTTLFWMAEEARERGLTFHEHSARWLVVLAIRLTEENREPNRYERFKLRCMRIGNGLINARPSTA